MMTSARVNKLKGRLRDTKPSICIERVKLITDFYKECTVEASVLVRAKSLAHILENMTIYIADAELIVGNHATEFRMVPVFPEFGSTWIINEVDKFKTRSTDPLNISDENKAELKDLLKNWEGRSFNEIATARLSKAVLEAEQAGILSVGSRITSTGHVVPNYPKVLKLGLAGIIQEAKGEIDAIKTINQDTQRKIDFLEAVIITCESAIQFAERFSLEAKRLAEKEKDQKRKAELELISVICQKVPKNPPENFYEAMQFVWFVHLVIQIETNGHSIGLGRFDQYMHEYYKKDVEANKLNDDQCVELIECLWMKITELIKVRDSFEAQAFAGYPMWQNVVIGGQAPDGSDATNKLSSLVLDATNCVKTTQPTVSFRHHDNIKSDFFEKALKMVQEGLATPAFFNDKLVVPLVLAKGATIEEARDWSIEGCVECYVTGKTDGRPVVGYVNGVKTVEMVLNNGIDPLTGKQIGVKTGELNSFKNIEDVMAAVEKQMKHFIKLMLDGYNIVGALHATRIPAPFASATIDDCIKNGKSLQEGGAKYNFSGCFLTSLANAADSLAAIEEVVFKDKTLTLSELNEILKNNFKDQENIRQLLLNKPQKFGNDNDFVDGIARQIVAIYSDELENYRDSRGGKYVLSILSQSFNVLQGKSVGATPDGRLAYEALSDNASPAAGRDVNGPTAAVKSISKIDQMKALTGTLLNMKFDPAIVKGEKGLDILGNVIKTYFDLLGEHIQINVIDEATLRDAQKNPQAYKNLMVRVAGYSAYFVELDKDVQENLISRTTHTHSC